MRRRGFTLVELIVAIALLVIVGLLVWQVIGFFRKEGANGGSKQDGFAGLKGNVGGKWQLAKGNSDLVTLELTDGNTAIYKEPYSSEKFGKFEFNNSTLVFTGGNGLIAVWRVDFASDREMLLTHDAIAAEARNGPILARGWLPNAFVGLSGRWKRIAAPKSIQLAPPMASPLTDAEQRVAKYEAKRAALEPLLEKAQADRGDLVEKLRAAGVNGPADLKGNSRGQQLAGSLQRLSAEIDGLERQVAALDSAVLDAKAVVRRMEREKAGISGDELQNLTEQLREAEEKADGAAKQPLTPLDLDVTLRKALSTKPAPAKAPKSSIGSRFPVTINEVLTPSARTKRFDVRFQKGKTYRIDLKSNQFDPYLFLRIGGSIVQQDGDGGGNRNARIVYRPTESGNFQVEATSVNRDDMGAFTLEIREE